jgi:hypothetical protein
MVNFTEAVQVGIIVVLISILMSLIESKYKPSETVSTTFFHYLTFSLVLIPWFIIGVSTLFNFNWIEGSFIIVILFSIVSYIKRLGISFFEREVFTNINQWVIFYIYVTLTSFYYSGDAANAAVTTTLMSSLIPVVGFYHLNKYNISKIELIITILVGFFSLFIGWIGLVLFYCVDEKAVVMHNKVSDMQIKSWQIVLLGIIPNIFILLLAAYGFLAKSGDVALGYAMGILFGYIALVGLIMAILPILCLKSSKDNIRKFGAIISILFGLIVLIGILGIFKEFGIFEDYSILLGGDFIFVFAPEFSLIFAGTYYSWRKV